MNQRFLKIAQDCEPELLRREALPVGCAEAVQDDSAWQGWSVRPVCGAVQELFQTGDRLTLDFGRHLVGYLSFDLAHHDRPLDSPVRLCFRFAETPYELAADFDSYHGSLSAAWLQEQIVTIEYDSSVTLPRRYAFRYVQVEVMDAPERYGVSLTGWSAETVSSADEKQLGELKGACPELLEIDRVCAATLRDCMQTVYEDGPKRDRRLWLGDLRLQALTDYTLFSNTALVRRCLYLFAACAREDGIVPSCLYEKPHIMPDNIFLTDYALLFCVSLAEYYENTHDRTAALDLFGTAKRQVEYGLSLLDSDGIVMPQQGWWAFIDWCDGLEYVTCMQGVLIYALDRMAYLAGELGEGILAASYRKDAERLRALARERLFDPEKNAFINPYDHGQYSVAAQVWMILARVLEGKSAQQLLKDSLQNPASLKPVTPYLQHYVLEAMAALEMWKELKEYMVAYWGSMVQRGADTFWEVYRPQEPMLSPYGDALINSACHAWSCSPSFFIRRYLAKME